MPHRVNKSNKSKGSNKSKKSATVLTLVNNRFQKHFGIPFCGRCVWSGASPRDFLGIASGVQWCFVVAAANVDYLEIAQ